MRSEMFSGKFMFRNALVMGVVAIMVATTVQAAEIGVSDVNDGPLIKAIKTGKPIIDVRYRFESKDQDGFSKGAYANTVRTRLGFETGEIGYFKALLEFENVTAIDSDRFNSTTNGVTEFPVIADPNATEINRAQIEFTGINKTSVIVGRQRYNLNNHRFVGAVDFRQNQQTFDAMRFSSKAIDRVSLDYLYISDVHRIFGDDHPVGEFDSNSHILSAAFYVGAYGTLKGYGILLDLEEVPVLSSETWGIRYENSFSLNKADNVSLAVVAEYASQSDYADNQIDYHEAYIHGEAALRLNNFKAGVGWERLGGNGVIGFSTPLATLHKFQGFADVFLSTPATGLDDVYGNASYNWADLSLIKSVKIFAAYHGFSSKRGNFGFGSEFDIGAEVKVNGNVTAELKGAQYYGGTSGFADRNLIWISLRFQY